MIAYSSNPKLGTCTGYHSTPRNGCIFLFLALLFIALPTHADEIRFAAVGKPTTLDQQISTSEVNTTIAAHVFETLYDFDSTSVPQRMLAASETVEDDGKLISIRLRDGLSFHDGSPLDSGDVLASLNRWGAHGARGPQFYSRVKSITATSRLDIQIVLKQPYGAWKHALAITNGGAIILPQHIAEQAGAEPIERQDYIGTGPFQFIGWSANHEVTLERFTSYRALDAKPDGYTGKRAAQVERLKFIPVPDVGNRISGIKSGAYHYAQQIPWDYHDELNKNPNISVSMLQNPVFGMVFFNSKDGVFKTNYKLRQAILLALDMEKTLIEGKNNERWVPNGSIYQKNNTWYSNKGIEGYRTTDAKSALNQAYQAGYSGLPIRLLASTNYPFHFQLAVSYSNQLQDAGFDVDLQIYDWKTLVKKRADPTQWDMFVTHHSYVPDPTMLSFMSERYPGWWDSPEKRELKGLLSESTGTAARQQAWHKMQELIYQQLPALKTGDHFSYDIYSPKLKGMKSDFLTLPRFWNVAVSP